MADVEVAPDRVGADGRLPRRDAGPADSRGAAGRGGRPGAGRGRAARGRAAARPAYTDAAEAFASPEVDAVVIAAPARFHADLVVAAAAAGKGVFCEKPMGLALADVDRAIDAARAAGVVLQVGFNRRFAPDWRAARALLDDGTLGTPRLLRSVTRDPGGFDPVQRRAEHDLQRDPDPRLRRAALPQPGRRGRRGVRHRGRAGRAGLARPGPARHRAGRRAVRQRRARAWPRPASRRPTATTCAARCSAPAAWRRWATAAAPAWSSPAPAGRLVDDRAQRPGAAARRLRRGAGGVRRRRPHRHARPRSTGEDARAALAIALAAAESVRAGRPVRIDEVAK